VGIAFAKFGSAAVARRCMAGRVPQSHKISHIDMGDDYIDIIISHVISP
jgi:hypothetical protein